MENSTKKRRIFRRGKARRGGAAEAGDPWYKKYVIPAVVVVLTGVTTSLVTAYFNGAFRGNTMRATLSSKAKYEANVTLKEYLDQLHAKNLNAYTEQQLSAPGFMAYTRVELEGFKGKPCTIQGVLMDAASRSKIELPIPWKDFRGLGETITSERISDEATGFVWVPDVKLQNPFYISIQALSPNSVLLDTSETDIINPQPSPTPTPDKKRKQE
jgi:hypothetical protein